MTAYATSLRTLRRLPREVVLEIAGRPIRPVDPQTCLCGWALRIGLAMETDTDPEKLDPVVYGGKLAALYGGTAQEWDDLFDDIVTEDDGSDIAVERAFMRRVMEVSA